MRGFVRANIVMKKLELGRLIYYISLFGSLGLIVYLLFISRNGPANISLDESTRCFVFKICFLTSLVFAGLCGLGLFLSWQVITGSGVKMRRMLGFVAVCAFSVWSFFAWVFCSG